MRRVTVAALLAALLASSALASMEAIDSDGDGQASFEELSAVHADLTQEAFDEIDTDDDSLVSVEEYDAAVAAGTLTAG